MPREKSLGSSTHRFMRVWGNREQYIANEQMAEHCGKYHFTNCYIGHQIVPTFSKNSQSEHSQIVSKMRGKQKCQTLLFELFLEPKFSVNQLDFNSEVNEEPAWQSCSWPPFGERVQKILNQCSVPFAQQFKPRHINTYIG